MEFRLVEFYVFVLCLLFLVEFAIYFGFVLNMVTRYILSFIYCCYDYSC